MTPTDTDDNFLREVDEGVRRDQMTSLWQRYGVVALIALVVFLGALGGWLWWREEQGRNAGVAGESLLQAMAKLEVGDNAAARPVFDRLAKDGPAGYRPLAMMMQAADSASSGDNVKSIKLLDAIAADTKAPQPVRDAALIKSVRQGFDALPPATVVARLKDLAVPGNPWFGIAGEMTALAHVKAGAPEQAKPLLIAIVRDNSLPPSLRNRAAQLALALGVETASLQLTGRAAGGAATELLPAPAVAGSEDAAPADPAK